MVRISFQFLAFSSPRPDGLPPRRLTDWKIDRAFRPAGSRAGRRLAFARGDTFSDSDVVLVKEFR